MKERVVEPASPLRDLADPSPPETVVSCDALSKRYGEVVAVDGVTFSLERGTVTGFLGPNGAGKTTTLRMLLGLAEPTAGEALVFGRRYKDLEQPIRRVGAVLESTDYPLGSIICALGPDDGLDAGLGLSVSSSGAVSDGQVRLLRCRLTSSIGRT
jgi:ABC-type phosphonate transport system ATPase subunit